MSARRLGDLDPFTWIRDTRDDILVEKVLNATSPRIGTDSKMEIDSPSLLQSQIEKSIEVTISFNVVNGEKITSVEINKEGHPPAKINIKT